MRSNDPGVFFRSSKAVWTSGASDLVGCNAVSGVIGKHISRRILGGSGVCCNGW
ncbi:MAG: hypothetical protein KH128_02580 [Firmicutes bacterium]|nr:hypothetical protein [Bacillota bacterium]